MRNPSAAGARLLACSSLVLLILCGCGDPAGEYATPKSAAVTFATAVREGNAAKAKEASVGDGASADVLEAVVLKAAATRRLQKAAEARFGPVDVLSGSFANAPATGPSTAPAAAAAAPKPAGAFKTDFVTEVTAAAETGPMKVEGDSARIVDPSGRTLLTLRKTAGGWKVDRRDLSAMGQAGRFVQTMRDFARAYDDTAAEVEAGKFSTADAAREAAQARVMAVVQKNLAP